MNDLAFILDLEFRKWNGENLFINGKKTDVYLHPGVDNQSDSYRTKLHISRLGNVKPLKHDYTSKTHETVDAFTDFRWKIDHGTRNIRSDNKMFEGSVDVYSNPKLHITRLFDHNYNISRETPVLYTRESLLCRIELHPDLLTKQMILFGKSKEAEKFMRRIHTAVTERDQSLMAIKLEMVEMLLAGYSEQRPGYATQLSLPFETK